MTAQIPSQPTAVNSSSTDTKHGLLNKQQKQDLHECFSMLDADQKGRVSVDNLLAAFHVLEVEVDSNDVKDLIAAVDRKGFGSITYVDFEAVMARSMLQTANPAEETVHMSSTVRLSPNAGSIPFHEIARAFRRKQMVAAIMGSSKSRQQLLNRHADRCGNDETHGRSLMAMRLHLEQQRVREPYSRSRTATETPSQPHAAPVIRLRDIAKHLPTSIREAVADAALYDPPSPHTAPDSHLEHTAPQKTVSGDMQHLPTRAAAPAVYHDTVAIPPYEQSLAESSPAKTTVSSAQKSAGAALQALASAAHKDGVAAHAHRQSEESHLNTTHAASRQLPAAAQHAKHGTAAESAAPAWRNPAELSSREVALEKLLAAKLSQPVQQQREIVSEASVKSVGRSTVRFRHSTSVFGRKPTSAPIVKHAPSAVPAPSLSGIAPHAVEVAPRRSADTVAIGDDGLPVGVFERHNLSPRKSAAAPVTHQQHLDSFRLIELRTFREHQQQKQHQQQQAAAESHAGSNHKQQVYSAGGHTDNGADAQPLRGESTISQQQHLISRDALQVVPAGLQQEGYAHTDTCANALQLESSALSMSSTKGLQMTSNAVQLESGALSFEGTKGLQLTSNAGRSQSADAAVQSMFRTSRKQAEVLLQQATSLQAAKVPMSSKAFTSNPAFSIPTTTLAANPVHTTQQRDAADPMSASVPEISLQTTAENASQPPRVHRGLNMHLGSATPSALSKQGFGENLWAGIGGYGRNGRGKAASSAAALQTPRPKVPIRRVRSRQQNVPLPSIARHLWQDKMQQEPQVGTVQGSAGSLNAAALLTLAGQSCEAIVPRLDAVRAAMGKHGLTLWEAAC